MKPAVTLAKLEPPRLPAVFERSRLFAVLDAAREKRLILVSGPPGAGKTTLIASYLKARGFPCLWYQVDAGDEDPAGFFHYLGLAVPKTGARSIGPLPHLTPEFALGVDAFARQYFRALYLRLGSSFYLVLDNYQESPATSRLHSIVKIACLELPPEGHLILISRGGCPPELSRFQVEGTLSVIGWDALQLTLDEAQGLARLYGRAVLKATALERLNEQVGGWLAGLLAAFHHGPGPWPAGELPPVASQAIFDYFAIEVFSTLDRDTQERLLELALLPRLPVAVVEKLTAGRRAVSLLDRLSRNSYFTTRHGGPSPEFQFHPLFREFLAGRARDRLLPVQLQEIRQTAAALLEKCGQSEAALMLYQELRDTDAAVRLILRHAPQLAGQGRYLTLAAWLAPLPEKRFDADPWLWYWQGIARLLENPFQSRRDFERAYGLFREQGDALGRLYAWSGIADAIFFSYAEFDRWDAWVRELEDLLGDRPLALPPDLGARLACSLFSILAFRQPQNRRLQAWAEAALRQGETAADRTPLILARLHWATFHIWRGDLAAAEVMLAAFGDVYGKGDVPLVQIVGSLVESTLAVHAGDHERALKAVTAGLAAAEDSGIRLWDGVLLDHAVMTNLQTGDFVEADQYLARLSATVQQMRVAELCYYHFVLAWRALLTGRLTLAERHCEESYALASRSGVTYFITLTELGLALILHEAHKRPEAEEHMAHAEAIGKKIGNNLIRLNSLFWYSGGRTSRWTGATKLRPPNRCAPR